MAIQMSRNLDDFAVFFILAREARKAFGSLPVSKEDMRSLLTERYGFEPNDSEVETARDITNHFGTALLDAAQMKNMELDIMLDASRKVAPGIEKRTWSLESSKKADLITSDRPVVLWNPPLPQDRYKGVGIEDAEEIWLPVDRKRILILRNSGPSGTRRIGPERVSIVNQHIARHCGKAIVAHPSVAGETAGIELASRRPTDRFSKGPAFDQDTGKKVADEVWHIWRPTTHHPTCNPPLWEGHLANSPPLNPERTCDFTKRPLGRWHCMLTLQSHGQIQKEAIQKTERQIQRKIHEVQRSSWLYAPEPAGEG